MQLLHTRRTPTERRGGNNGGFPDPPAGEPVRVVRCAHRACGAETRVRLPGSLPEGVLRRVVCDSCLESFDPATESGAANGATATAAAGLAPAAVAAAAAAGEPAAAPASPAPPALADRLRSLAEEGRDRALDLFDAARDRVELLVPSRPGGEGGGRLGLPGGLTLPSLPEIPRNRLWAWASVPLALLGVIVGLLLLQGDSGSPNASTTASGGGARAANAKFIEQPGYSLALPSGWKRINPPAGATFAAKAKDGSADATLWIEKEPGLSMKQFERRSLRQLGEVGDNPRVVDRVTAPTIEGSIVELRADTPIADGVTTPYRVTLRGAGPYRHYLATSEQPGADPKIAADIELLHNSLRPEVRLAGFDGAEGSG